MSEMAPVTPESPGPQGPDSSAVAPPMARYTIHVPVHNESKEELAHVLGALRKALTASGFNGRTVIRKAQGDWRDYDTEEVDLVMIDAPDDPSILQTLITLAQGVKSLSAKEGVYLTKHPIETYLL